MTRSERSMGPVRSERRKRALQFTTAIVLALARGEWECRRVSRQYLPVRTPLKHGDTEAIVVLGFPSTRGDQVSAVQRYRARIAVRSCDRKAGRSVLVFTGRSRGRGRSRRSEAAVMAEYAVGELGVDPADVVLEEEAKSTWENIQNTVPLVEGFSVVKIASNTFHARKARRYMYEQAPHLVARLRPAADHRIGELWYLKPFLALSVLLCR